MHHRTILYFSVYLELYFSRFWYLAVPGIPYGTDCYADFNECSMCFKLIAINVYLGIQSVTRTGRYAAYNALIQWYIQLAVLTVTFVDSSCKSLLSRGSWKGLLGAYAWKTGVGKNGGDSYSGGGGRGGGVGKRKVLVSVLDCPEQYAYLTYCLGL
jgi:hypothetical protein